MHEGHPLDIFFIPISPARTITTIIRVVVTELFIEKFDIDVIISPLLHDRYLEASIAHQ